MKIGPLVLLSAWIVACGCSARAQDLGQAAVLNQQAMQGAANLNRPAVQINPFAAQPASTKTGQGQLIFKSAALEPPRALPDCGCAKQPLFSALSGDLAAGTRVTILSPSPDAAIYYTTDGWTPTEASARYTGPIAVDADTRLQAIAVEPNKLPSSIAEANFTVSGSQAPKAHRTLAVEGILRQGTPLRLVTGSEVSSETAQVGDHILLRLDENVMAGDTVVAPKGSKADATIVRIERAGRAGKPGVLVFEVQSLHAQGITIPLVATLTLAAPDAAQGQKVTHASQVHVAGALPPGEEAEIEPGMTLTAAVRADTTVLR